MPNFHYQALNASGHLVAGDVVADDAQQAVVQLQTRGLVVQSIGLVASELPMPSTEDVELSTPAGQPSADAPHRSVGESLELSVLRSHMATILASGRAIVPALRAYAEEMPAGWQRRQLVGVCRVLERNDPSEATAALAELPESWIPLLSAATSSPDPGHVLHEFLKESKRSEDLRQKWWLALAYPLILIGLVTVVMTVISRLVIPEFRQIFDEFDLQLPDLTQWMLRIATFLAAWGIPLIAVIGLLFVLLILNANRLLPAAIFGWVSDRFRPPYGRRTTVARLARFTADLLEAGVSVPDALRIAGFAVNQSRMQQAAWQLANDIESTGEFAQRAYQRSLTATVAYALSPDVPPASKVRLLREISSCHAERVRIGLSWTSGIVEPVAICLVGFAVGMTVVALFLPLVKLVEGLSN